MKLWKILGIELYEVGDIIITSSSNNPSSRFKGTWELIAQGMTIVGVKASDSDFNTVNKSGGAKTHTLTTNEMPNHTHTIQAGARTAPWEAPNFVVSYQYQSASAINSNVINHNGGSQAHNNLQPYITKYIWERVS